MTNLEMERRQREMSQQELGRELLYSHSVVSRLERGTLTVNDVKPRLRAALERYFNSPLERLLSPVGRSTGDAT
jgi:ribosome-binding protein aMBF1 (putative translation factor)